MANWYDKYLTIYGKPFSDVPEDVKTSIRDQLNRLQSPNPLISVFVIAYNEESRLAACLWSLSELNTKFPIEILGVNNNSKDKTEEVYQALGLPYFNETRQSPGFARQCGLQHARGKYHFFIDADTFYPSCYVDKMMDKLQKPGVSCVGTFWSFYPDENHSAFSLFWFELIRDTFFWVQHFKRPELNIRTDIRRGEDGSLALSLKKFGKIDFLYCRKARPVTGYGTLNEGSLLQSLWNRAKVQLRGITRVFYSVEHYEDKEDNLVKNK